MRDPTSQGFHAVQCVMMAFQFRALFFLRCWETLWGSFLGSEPLSQSTFGTALSQQHAVTASPQRSKSISCGESLQRTDPWPVVSRMGITSILSNTAFVLVREEPWAETLR